MKKITFSILLLATVAIVNAQQEFKPFKVDLSTGYAIPSGKGAKGGILFVAEPKYAVIPNLSAGIRLEFALMARGRVDQSGNVAEVDVKAAGSYLLTGDYYFVQSTVRPFAGVGVGLYSLAGASSDANSASAGTGSKFGEMVRGGVEISHFRLGLEYNIVPTTNVETIDANGVKTTSSTKNSYMGIKLGFTIGGGRIKK
jgi:outer membrane protein W